MMALNYLDIDLENKKKNYYLVVDFFFSFMSFSLSFFFYKHTVLAVTSECRESPPKYKKKRENEEKDKIKALLLSFSLGRCP